MYWDAAGNGPALPPTDDKVGAGIPQDVGVDVRGSGVGLRDRLSS